MSTLSRILATELTPKNRYKVKKFRNDGDTSKINPRNQQILLGWVIRPDLPENKKVLAQAVVKDATKIVAAVKDRILKDTITTEIRRLGFEGWVAYTQVDPMDLKKTEAFLTKLGFEK